MRRITFTVVCFFLFMLSASAQTVDEILAKSFAAEGGIAKLQSIQSRRITGDFEAGSMQAGFTRLQKRPSKFRQDVTIQGLNMVQAYDGQAGWQIVPFTGKKDPEVMPADDLKQIQEEADFDGPVMNYKQKGNTVELVGKEKMEGTDAYHLKVTLKNGDIRHIYLDADSFLPIKLVAKVTMRGSEMELESTLGDYKQVEGVMVPFSIEQHPVGGQGPGIKITVTKVEMNVPVDDATFKMPAAAPAEATPPGKTGTAPSEPAKKPDTGSKPPQN